MYGLIEEVLYALGCALQFYRCRFISRVCSTQEDLSLACVLYRGLLLRWIALRNANVIALSLVYGLIEEVSECAGLRFATLSLPLHLSCMFYTGGFISRVCSAQKASVAPDCARKR